ncbi:restriction endonuclease subunit S [Fusobacterium animalis]|uniref:restriction endonuclease subunit S n=1 Tax=Fusobacterium animalis TaxID=76859 RepID=UPI0030CC6758
MNKNIQYKKLGEVCDFIAGGTPSKSKIEYWKDGNIPWIKISDFKEKYIKISAEKITKIGLEKSSAKILEKGTILYTIFASVGKVAILDMEATTNQAIVGINLKKDISIDKDFLYYFLCSIENNVKNQARGVAQNNINISILKNINIPIFSLSSQKNIAKMLSEVENFLENLKRKKSLVNILNKSLFITFNKNGIEKRLDDIADISMGQSPLSQSYNIDKKGLPFYQGKTEFGDIYIKEPIIYCNSPIKIVEKNDILMSVRAPVGDVNIATQKSCIGRGLASIRAKKVDYLYLFYLLKERKIKIEKMGVGSTFKAINKNNISSLQIPIIEMSKQNRIKKYLTLIEKLSFEIEKSIKEAENLYNSLMNKYFD